MIKELLFSGVGGQGVLTAGNVLAYAGAAKNLEVTCIPSYGSEMRGGYVNCTVKLGNEEISNPFPKWFDILVAFNPTGLQTYSGRVKRGGTAVINISAVPVFPDLSHINIIAIPADTIAKSHGATRSANLAILGAAITVMDGLITLDEAETGLCRYFKNVKDNSKNIAILQAGYAAALNSRTKGVDYVSK